MKLQDYNTSQRHQAVLLNSTRITAEASPEEVRELTISLKQDGFNYQTGQSIGIIISGSHAFGNKEHLRLYTIANPPEKDNNGDIQLTLCVKRCNYIDEYSGEEFKGIASNYLCDLKPGAQLTLCGPYGLPFTIPEDRSANIIMIGMGTGIAPFRAFIKQIYNIPGDWPGKVQLFYGARTGLEMLYMNDQRDDFANYYDLESFLAFKALSLRPHWGVPHALGEALIEREKDIWDLVCRHNTFIYVAGLSSINDTLNNAFSKIAGSEKLWEQRKAELLAEKRWIELIY